MFGHPDRQIWTPATIGFGAMLRKSLMLVPNISVASLKGVVQAKMVKIINFLFFAKQVSSCSGALRPKFLGG